MPPELSLHRKLRRQLLAVSPVEVEFSRRGFACEDPSVRGHLERVGGFLLAGYETALSAESETDIAPKLDQMDGEFRGFAFEGAAMALALLDRLSVGLTDRWGRFARGPGLNHLYMVHVGAGLAAARLGRNVRPLKSADPLLTWLVADGYGFHEGFFRWQESEQGRVVSKKIKGYARRAYDQGLGRSLWFVCGADSRRISDALQRLPKERWPDLWSGVGLACAYAGGANQIEIESLRRLAKGFGTQLAQGAAFAAQARSRAQNPTPHTDLASRILCGCGAIEAARATQDALVGLPSDGSIPAFEHWRRRLHERFRSFDAT